MTWTNLIFLLAAVLTAVVAQHQPGPICPPPESLWPCTCSDSERAIRCHSGRIDLAAIFDNASTYVDESTVFDWIRITQTELYEVPAGSIKTLKFHDVWIGENPNLVYVSPLAFNATYGVTTGLHFYQNRAFENTAEGDGSGDIYDFVKKFEVLDNVIMTANKISTIREGAFSNHPTLRDIYLGLDSYLRDIQPDVVSGSSNLEIFLIKESQITPYTIASTAFDGISNRTIVNLEFNYELTYLREPVIRPVLDHAGGLIVGGYTCGLWGCNYRRLYCGPEADWICENSEVYMGKLAGFYCNSPSPYDTLWDYCAAQGFNSAI